MAENVEIKNLYETAVKYASSFGKSFTFAPEDIPALEEILQYYYEDMAKSRPTERQMWSMALIWGAFLGETRLRGYCRQYGFEWVPEEDQPVITKPGGGTLAPVSKVFKRLHNGPEDSVVTYYNVMQDLLSREV